MPSGTYIVQPGDTLSAIAKRHGTTVTELARINRIRDPNRLSVGETLRLTATPPKPTYHVQALFLDSLRHPIAGLHYRMQCGGETVAGTSATNGLGKMLTLQRAATVKISAQIAWLGGLWMDLATVQARPGHNIVTLISPMVRIEAPLALHPNDAFGQPREEASTRKPVAQHPRGTPSVGQGKPQSEVAKGSGKGLHSREEKDQNGITRVVLSQDLPDLRDCFAAYTEEKITEPDWQSVAGILGCEVAVIKAFAQVESSGGGFIANSGTPPLPKILYERGYFSRLTNHKYDATNADLSMPASLKYLAKHDPKLYALNKNVPNHVWGVANYKRFVNACLLNENAAIESCSWGMFQIMGNNWKICGAANQQAFLKTAFTSERAQLTRLFVPFVENDAGGKLKAALIAKDWVKAARIYNGPGEAESNPPYHTKLKEAYERIKRSEARLEHAARSGPAWDGAGPDGPVQPDGTGAPPAAFV